MDSLTCVLAAHSDFPCGGPVRTEWYGTASIEVCVAHRQRAVSDEREDREDGSLAAWNAR